MVSNLSLELHSADSANFGHSQTPSLVSRPKFVKNYESQTENPSVVLNNKNGESANQAQNNKDSSLRGRIVDSHEAIQKIAQPNLARFVVQKIGFKDAVVPSADFLLESDKRGTPPKSEKRQLLARRGSGAGGAALLRKEKGDKRLKDSKANLSAKSRYKIVSKINFSKVPIQ